MTATTPCTSPVLVISGGTPDATTWYCVPCQWSVTVAVPSRAAGWTIRHGNGPRRQLIDVIDAGVLPDRDTHDAHYAALADAVAAEEARCAGRDPQTSDRAAHPPARPVRPTRPPWLLTDRGVPVLVVSAVVVGVLAAVGIGAIGMWVAIALGWG